MKFLEAAFLKIILIVFFVILSACLFNQKSVSAESAKTNVLFILDGSGSMWSRLDNVAKIVIAKDKMSGLVQELSADQFNIGLIAYGHRRKGDCDDIEVLAPLGKVDTPTIIKQIQSISPKGKTPITKSITLAAQQLESLEEETTIVLVSDGEETCEGDPCNYVKTLKDKGINFTMHVVGFDVNEAQKAQLSCIAKAGGGRYFNADSTAGFKKAITAVKKEVKVIASKGLLGPLPYLKRQDSPFFKIDFLYFHLENFEDHILNVPGIKISDGVVASTSFGAAILDSVDADDGKVDGKTSNGDSWWNGSDISISFNQIKLGRYPTHVGLVWTDGGNPIKFEAFDAQGNSLGTASGKHADTNFSGSTNEDRFYGIIHKDGISKVTIGNNGAIEIDHIQYGAIR